MLSITTLLFPACPDLLLEEITREGQTLFLTVRSSKKALACPDCAQESVKVHSRYPRTLADVSLMDYAVRLRVQARRFFCSNPACARTTKASPFADLAMAHARRTNRQASRLRAIAKELGGRPAARESENVLMPVEPPHAAAFATSCSHSRFSSPTRAWGRRLVAPQGANLRYAPRGPGTTPCCRALARPGG